MDDNVLAPCGTLSAFSLHVVCVQRLAHGSQATTNRNADDLDYIATKRTGCLSSKTYRSCPSRISALSHSFTSNLLGLALQNEVVFLCSEVTLKPSWRSALPWLYQRMTRCQHFHIYQVPCRMQVNHQNLISNLKI